MSDLRIVIYDYQISIDKNNPINNINHFLKQQFKYYDIYGIVTTIQQYPELGYFENDDCIINLEIYKKCLIKNNLYFRFLKASAMVDESMNVNNSDLDKYNSLFMPDNLMFFNYYKNLLSRDTVLFITSDDREEYNQITKMIPDCEVIYWETIQNYHKMLNIREDGTSQVIEKKFKKLGDKAKDFELEYILPINRNMYFMVLIFPIYWLELFIGLISISFRKPLPLDKIEEVVNSIKLCESYFYNDIISQVIGSAIKHNATFNKDNLHDLIKYFTPLKLNQLKHNDPSKSIINKYLKNSNDEMIPLIIKNGSTDSKLLLGLKQKSEQKAHYFSIEYDRFKNARAEAFYHILKIKEIYKHWSMRKTNKY